MATCSSQSRREKIGNYFWKEIKLLKIFGVSLSSDECLSYKIYSSVLFFVTLFMYSVLDTYELTKHELDVVSEMVIYPAGAVMALAKVTTVLLNRGKIKKLVEKLEKSPFAPNTKRGGGDAEDNLIKQCLLITKVQSLILWTVSCISLFGLMIYNLLSTKGNGDWKLAYGPLTVLNVTNTLNLKITWWYQNISTLVTVVNFTTIDLLLVALLVHISYQFKILQNSIRRLVSTNYDEVEKNANPSTINNQLSDQTTIDESAVSWNYLNISLKETVCYHVQITDLAKELENVFRNLLLLNFSIALVMLCFSILTASATHSAASIVKHLIEYVNISIPVFMICYWAEQLSYESQLVGKAAYESSFVGTDLRYQKSLVLIIRRSQNSTVLTAGKFSVISLTLFAWIIRTSYSSFMVLREVNSNTE